MNFARFRQLRAWPTLVACALLLQACEGVRPLHVDRLEDFTPDSKTFGFIKSTRFDFKLRVALAKKGFKVVKFASNSTVVQPDPGGDATEIYNRAEARYGLSLSYAILDTSIGSDALLVNASLEVTDLKNNEVLLVIERGGWTESPTFTNGGRSVFDDLADALSAEWDKSK